MVNDPQTSSLGAGDVLDALQEYLTARSGLRRRIRAATELSDSAWGALLELHAAGEQGLEVTPKQLAAALDLRSASITALVDKLVRLGFADRATSTTDRRGLTLSITPAGVEFVDQHDLARGPEEQVSARLEGDDAALVARFLGDLAAAADRSFPSQH